MERGPPSRMAGVTLVLIASYTLHVSQAPYAKAGHFWDEIGSDFQDDRLRFSVEIWVDILPAYRLRMAPETHVYVEVSAL